VKRVYRAASLLQVAHARNILLMAGVECELRNVHLAGALGDLPMMETWPQLYVQDSDERYALGALARAAAVQPGASWICEACAEVLEPQFTSCWHCGRDKPP
jgi:Putative prokaryotic signal transducing protein